MKQISYFFLSLFLFISCGKEKNTISKESQFLSANSSDSFSPDSIDGKLEDTSKGLEVQIPMSNDQLKNWIPEKIGKMDQWKLIVGHKLGMQMSGAIATYRESGKEEQQISLEVLDGAGATGAVMLKSINQKLSLEYEEQLETGYSRIYEREKIRVWEKYNSLEHSSEIEYVIGERFHFRFKGHLIQMDELWEFVSEVMKEMY
ncbi:hypothetical protein [Algoriphagus aquimarinus]|uniref:Uncharacterized protein n=1 Tax=Algoriphagus aquimarinus TaxID=237018 RepID=A0A1I1C367_9BACT|nr:hypothetical protein [Algoriphagus aquimarinus]SFB56486.1 hypothetical protein SAMN04489723_1213 [Algoriphagus aquimarinus]|tara:strand:- start:1797 stop:2405 length:609 start_codon:yes stop_codon:yes gene_type:complete